MIELSGELRSWKRRLGGLRLIVIIRLIKFVSKWRILVG